MRFGRANGSSSTNPEVVVNIASGVNSGTSDTPEEVQINLGSKTPTLP